MGFDIIGDEGEFNEAWDKHFKTSQEDMFEIFTNGLDFVKNYKAELVNSSLNKNTSEVEGNGEHEVFVLRFRRPSLDIKFGLLPEQKAFYSDRFFLPEGNYRKKGGFTQHLKNLSYVGKVEGFNEIYTSQTIAFSSIVALKMGFDIISDNKELEGITSSTKILRDRIKQMDINFVNCTESELNTVKKMYANFENLSKNEIQELFSNDYKVSKKILSREMKIDLDRKNCNLNQYAMHNAEFRMGTTFDNPILQSYLNRDSVKKIAKYESPSPDLQNQNLRSPSTNNELGTNL